MATGDDRHSTYLIKNAPSDRVDTPPPPDAAPSTPPDDRWRTSNPPPGDSLEAKWWPDEELGTAFRRWTGIPPARGDAGRAVAMKFLVEHLNVGELTAVGTAPRASIDLEPPDRQTRIRAMVERLGQHGPNEEAPDHGALLALGDEALPVLRDSFPGRLWFNRWEPHVRPPSGRSVSGLCRTLVAFGRAAVPHVAELLKSDDPEVRYYAILVAADLHHDLLVEPLAAVLFDEDQGVSRAALHALEAFRGREGLERLKTSLRALAVASDADQRSRLLAMRALAVLRDRGCIETLISALPERGVVGEAAWRVLRMLTAQDLGPEPEPWKAWFAKHGSRPRVEWLIEGLVHEDPEIRRIAGRDLRQTSGRDFGYRTDMPLERCREIRERYRLWWSRGPDDGP